MSKHTKNGDANQIAKILMDLTSGEDPYQGKNPMAVELGRLGGQKGGKARAESLSSERRIEIAKHAAKARWGKDG
ncbi:MAG: hypothetical protein ACI9XC_002248 [Gammaproteobacteria bacterium]|jgi:hypothetical protein